MANAGNSAREQGQALFDRAKAISFFRSAQLAPYELQIQFRLFVPFRMPLTGSYDEIWASPQQWRKKISAGDFQETIVHNQMGEWRAEDGGPEPLEMRPLCDAIDELSDLALAPGQAFEKIAKERFHKEDLECVDVREPGRRKRRFCFDSSTGHLQAIESLALRMQFTDYRPFGSRSFPKRMSASAKNEGLWDAEVQNLRQLSSVDSSWFERPAGSESYVSCLDVRRPKALKAPDGAYPPDLRQQHIQGSAQLDVEVGADGRTHLLRVIQSDNASFASSAYNAIRTWTFKPAMCGDVPVDTVVRVIMKFGFVP